MDAFDEALEQFKRSGAFIYEGKYEAKYLNTDHITRLKNSFNELDPNKTYWILKRTKSLQCGEGNLRVPVVLTVPVVLKVPVVLLMALLVIGI